MRVGKESEYVLYAWFRGYAKCGGREWGALSATAPRRALYRATSRASIRVRQSVGRSMSGSVVCGAVSSERGRPRVTAALPQVRRVHAQALVSARASRVRHGAARDT